MLFRAPVATHVEVSPDGERALITFPDKKGNLGLATFETAPLVRGEPLETAILKPSSRREVGSFFWIDSEWITFEQVIDNRGSFGTAISSADFEKQYFSWNQGAWLQRLTDSLPQVDKHYGVMAWDAGATWRERHLALMELEGEGYSRKLRAKKVYINNGTINSWVMNPKGELVFVRENAMDTLRWANPQPTSEKAFAELVGKQDYYALDVRRIEWLEPNDSVIVFNKDHDAVFMQRYKDSDYAYIQRFDLAEKRFDKKRYAVEGWDLVGSVIRAQAGGPPLGIRYHTEKPAYFWFNPNIKAVHQQVQEMAPGSDVHIHGLVNDNTSMLFTVSSDIDPGRVFLYDFESKALTKIFSCRPWMDQMPRAQQTSVWFQNRNGERIHAYLTLPPGHQEGERVPLIALTHGGPHARDTWGFDPEVQFYALLGYGVLQVNYRGSDGFGDTYELMASPLAASKAAPEDVADGVRWAIEHGFADADRVALMGTSFGAFVSLAVAYQEPDLPACVIGFAGLYDWALSFEEDLDGDAQYMHNIRTLDDITRNMAEYRRLSPANHGYNIKAPVMLVHGHRDQRVSTAQAKRMAESIREGPGSVRLVLERYLLHGFGNLKHRVEHYTRIARFLEEHMGE